MLPRLSLKKFLSSRKSDKPSLMLVTESLRRCIRISVSASASHNGHSLVVLLRLEKGTYICCSLLNQKELEMNALFAMFSELLES